MTFEQQQDFARQVADLNKYGQAINQCESVEEVVSLTVEAISLLFDLTDITVYETRDGDLVVRSSTAADGDSEIAREAVETGDVVSRRADEGGPAVIAVPADIVDDVVTVIEVRSREIEVFGEEYAQPLEILASHVATAMSNIRSRERLERAREDLARRKEMIEMYDRLLRHDIGNDLQVIGGFADVVATQVEDDQTTEYAEKIQRAANNCSDLINRVGSLVSTLEAEREPDPTDLQSLLAETVRDVETQYESLAVEFDPEAFDYRVYAGDLLDSVFTNVLTNAAVHNEGEVSVTVYAEKPSPDRVVVGVADDGTGVPEDVRDEIFELGAKGPDSEGSGFGLGFVRALTESYGGTVEVTESDAGGADFRVSLARV